MKFSYSILLAVFCAWALPASIFAQGPGQNAPLDGGAYCNVFYIKSGDLDKLPLEDVCFIVDHYTIADARHLRCIGPIEGNIDLFRTYPWTLNFHMPIVEEGTRFTVELPEDLEAGSWDMEPGKFALTISDNRHAVKGEEVEERVSLVAVGGWGRLTSFKAQGGDMAFPEYELQMDLKVKEVETLEGKLTPVGEAFRLRMVLKVQALE